MSDEEDVLYVRLTGKEVHKAVANYIKDTFKIDPRSIAQEAASEAKVAAREAVSQVIREYLNGPTSIEFYVREAINRMIESDTKRVAHYEFERVSRKVVEEYKQKIEDDVRASLASEAESIISRVIKKKDS